MYLLFKNNLDPNFLNSSVFVCSHRFVVVFKPSYPECNRQCFGGKFCPRYIVRGLASKEPRQLQHKTVSKIIKYVNIILKAL